MIIPPLKKTYNGKTVLNTPELNIPDGSIAAICGHNGSGKSTLARILAGIIRDDSGQTGTTCLDRAIGYMSQTSLPFRMSVRNNLLLNSEKSISKKENQVRADQLLSEIGLQDIAHKNAARLSGGQTERMALARILMKNYGLLILDEPTASMDQNAIPSAEKLIREYRDRTGCTILLITHSSSQANRLANLIITLEEGRICKTEPSCNKGGTMQ